MPDPTIIPQNITTPRAARTVGASHYWSQRLCPNGHLSLRRADTGRCIVCAQGGKSKWQMRGSRPTVPQKQPPPPRRRTVKPVNRALKLKYSRATYGQAAKPTRPEPLTCEICKRPSNRTLHLDHDHNTGYFRGWLCYGCNTALGFLRDDIGTLTAAIDYLTRAQSGVAQLLHAHLRFLTKRGVSANDNSYSDSRDCDEGLQR